MADGTADHRDHVDGARAGTAQPVAGPSLGVPSQTETPRPLPAPEAMQDPAAAADGENGVEHAADAANTLSDDNSSIYGDQDDAQSFIQPAISPMATRLSSPKTPAAERAMAMDRIANRNGGGYFSAFGPAGGSVPGTVQISSASPASIKPQTAMSSVFHSGTRHGRSSSVGTDAFKRLSKALPSISFPNPSAFLPNLTTPSFFSSANAAPSLPPPASPSPPRKTSAAGSPTQPASPKTPANRARQSVQPSLLSHVAPESRLSSSSPRPQPVSASLRSSSPVVASSEVPTRPHPQRPPSVASRRSYVLRRSTSDDSLLYHTLSRTPSQGDTDQFDHVREQVNSRVKAIMDSFDRPSFKLPQLPTFFPDTKGVTHPSPPREPLDAALESLTGDLVVLGGYRGSILRSAEPPHRQLWVPVKVGLKIRKVNLEVGLDPEDEENMEQHMFASGMLQHIGPVDISRRLFKKLRECDNARSGKLRVHDYGYDWRLSPHRLSRQLIAFLEKLPCNDPAKTPAHGRGAQIIAHSLGGLITRHAVNQRPELFSGVVFVGTPQRCVNILGPLRNGDAVLLNEKVLTAQVNFSLRTTFAFLPEDGFCFVNSKDPNEEYRVDFYDVNDWIRYRWSPCVAAPPLPPYQPSHGGLKRSSTISALLEDLSGSIPSLPLRSRNNSQSQPPDGTSSPSPIAAAGALAKDRLMEPQMDASSSPKGSQPNLSSGADMASSEPPMPSLAPQPTDPQRTRALAYLTRTLSETKQFRAELAHRPEHTAANAYPPLAVIFGKGVPTVYAARVGSRAAIACADAYDDLVFRSGDGVVLAREALLPPGYDYVRNGYVSTDRGHVGMLGDLAAVGKALEAVVRGRKKGIGLGPGRGTAGRSEKSRVPQSTRPTTPTPPAIQSN